MADNCLSHILTEWHCIDPKIAWIGNENFLLGFFLSLEIYLSPVAEDWAKWQRVGKMPLHPMLSFWTNPAPIGCCPRKVKCHSVTDWRPKMWMNLPHGKFHGLPLRTGMEISMGHGIFHGVGHGNFHGPERKTILFIERKAYLDPVHVILSDK